MTKSTRRDLERRIKRLTESEDVATETIELPPWAVEKLSDYEPGEDMSEDLASIVRQADLERMGATGGDE